MANLKSGEERLSEVRTAFAVHVCSMTEDCFRVGQRGVRLAQLVDGRVRVQRQIGETLVTGYVHPGVITTTIPA